MVRYVMTIILAVRRNTKLMMTLNICLVPLKKILQIKYTYGVSETTNGEKYLVEGNNIVYLLHNRLERGVIQKKGRCPERKNILQSK